MRFSPALSEPKDKSGRQTHRWTCVQHAEAGLAGYVSGTQVSSVTGLGFEVQIVQWVDRVHCPCLSSCRTSQWSACSYSSSLQPGNCHGGLFQNLFRLFSHLEFFQCVPLLPLLLYPWGPAWLVRPQHILLWAAALLAP